MSNKTGKEADLGSDRIGGLLFKLALPAILAQVINLLYNLVDRMYIGHIPREGSAALTGVGVTMPVIMCISAFAALVSMGGAPRASIMMGKGKQDEAEKILGNCTTMLVVVALFLTGIIQLWGKDILMVFGASNITISYAWNYMQIYSVGTIFVQLALGLNAFINAQGFAGIGMLTVVIGAVCNIILDPVFIFGFHMGVRGGALATILSQGVSCVWIVCFLLGKRTTLRLKLKNMAPELSVMGPCITLGVAPFIMQFTESVLNICFNTSLLKYGGDIAVGAMTILSSIMQMSVLPVQGLTQGAQPIIGFNYGAKKTDRVKKTFRLLLVSCVGYTVGIWLICMLAPGLFIGIFTSSSEMVRFSKWAIRIYMACSLVMGVQMACQQTFIALGNAKTSVFLALLRKVILLIPLIYILPCCFSNKLFAVFLAEPVADVIAVSTTALLFFREYRRLDKEILEN
ncbi:MAG: MATE family efflux transporter [Lachnospiraceae bacterium]|nr:MATE family efflux transporter [Agathobacter sp.]MDD6444521.1 MATE family efflux transporter [Lachnospiraceae bacterium]MDY4892125.1 MATE family efflux transporter [Agathobacter sp.]